jgi:hypothetical protein
LALKLCRQAPRLVWGCVQGTGSGWPPSDGLGGMGGAAPIFDSLAVRDAGSTLPGGRLTSVRREVARTHDLRESRRQELWDRPNVEETRDETSLILRGNRAA